VRKDAVPDTKSADCSIVRAAAPIYEPGGEHRGDETMAVELSEATLRRLEILFAEPQRARASQLLIEACGNNLPLCESATPAGLERIRFAALKLSGGDLSGLEEAISLAKLDWRDLLMAADFGDTSAHVSWWPRGAGG
jgi:hypothetical protein